MVAETDDKEERTGEPGETPSADSALIGWLGAIHAEIRAARAESREDLQAARVEFREGLQAARAESREESQAMRAEFREEQRETRRELSERIDRVEQRVARGEERDSRVEERVARIEGGIEAERDKKNKTIARLSIIIGTLIGLAGVAVGVISWLN